jgi:hypothetical protein
MTKSGSKHMKIKLDTATGNMVEVADENGNPATPVTQTDMDQIYQSQGGFKYVGVILHAESSPGCVYFIVGGRAFKVCR